MNQPRFFETKIIPAEGDIVFAGARRELVVEDVPANSEHGHLIRTAYRENNEVVENTYVVKTEERLPHALTRLGSGRGAKTDRLYSEKLTEAGF